MKVLQVMAGAKFGGAEEFFTRLTIALHKTMIDQRVCLRRNESRARLLMENGVASTQLRFGGKLDFMTPFSLKGQIKDFKPDIVFSWMNRATLMCPKEEDFIHVGRLGGYYDLKYYKSCDHLVANTEDIATYLINNGWDQDKVHFLPNFVSSEKAFPIKREKFYTPKDAILILAMGRFHENKAFDVLLDAIARIPNIYLWVAGDGPLKKDLEVHAEKIGIKPRTRFLGWRDDTERIFAAADFFVCPSRHEPLGNVIIEAWAQGIPVIAADSLGPQTLIRHGKNGLLFPVDDVKSLGDSIRRLIQDSELAERLASQAQKDFESNFTENIVVGKYLEFFKRIVG